MTEIQWKSKKSKTTKGILIVKNGYEYVFNLTEKKHKYKKTRLKNKKWKIEIFLLGFTLYDEEIIEKILKERQEQALSYERVKQLRANRTYILHLSNEQYEYFQKWCKENNITTTSTIKMMRVGTGFNTHYIFELPKQDKKTKSEK